MRRLKDHEEKSCLDKWGAVYFWGKYNLDNPIIFIYNGLIFI